MDDFARNIVGRRKGGRTCPCCRETDKRHSRKLARHRLSQALSLLDFEMIENEEDSP